MAALLFPFVVTVLIASLPLCVYTFEGTPRGMMSMSCMYGFGVSVLGSEYDGSKKDRQWKVQCRRTGILGNDTCRWTYDFVNARGLNFEFGCDSLLENSYVSGLYSDFNAKRSDRRWRFECCSSVGVTLTSCVDTDWQNRYRADFNFTVPLNKVLAGISSHFRHGDRRWSFKLCEKSTIS